MAANPDEIRLLQRRIRVARGEEPGDLALVDGLVVNVFTRQIERANVVVADGWIAGVGPHDWEARERVSIAGQYLIPGLIDAHMHLESTLLSPAELARVVVPHGTATVIADPHEVANVLGVRGVEMLLEASAGLPLDVFFMAPSCVPCTSWEHSGAVLEAKEIRQLLAHPRILGLAEVMDFPALLAGSPSVLDKVASTQAGSGHVDGHAPGLSGRELVAYAAAGIRSDHESTCPDEALAKASLGMMVQVREGSSARNLDALLPLLVADRLGIRRLCTDDVYPHDLLDGHIEMLLMRVVAAGVPPAVAVRHATLVPALDYGLRDRGAVAPGYRAHLAVVDNVKSFRTRLVVHDGRIVSRDGEYLDGTTGPQVPEENTIHLGRLSAADFELVLAGDESPVVVAMPDQILTQHATVRTGEAGGPWKFDPTKDLALLASVERHRATGQIGLGLVRGFGFARRGAFGSSVAHDSHNVVLAGTHPEELCKAAQALAAIGGGFVVVANGQVVAQTPLPIAGLISRADAATVCRQMEELHRAASDLGCSLPNPFGTLSFLALPVIPELRITDQGLFDVVRQAFL